MIDCDHSPALISARRGNGGTEDVSVCRRCGELRVTAWKDGVFFATNFSLFGSYELLAASQAYRLMLIPAADAPVGKRIWKPLDFAHQRLYHVVRSWDLKENDRQQNFKDNHIVAADSPSHAAALVEATYQEHYDKFKETIPLHYSQGYPLNVLQPLNWTENGINILNAEFDEGSFVPGEFRCPKCQMRMAQRLLSREDMSVGVDPDPAPPECMNNCGTMVRMTWRDAAHEAFLINQRIGKRIRALEKAWPDGFAMPVEDDFEAEHEHDWHVDYEQPTSDVDPVHHPVVCNCGATACQEEGTGAIHDLVEPPKDVEM